MQHTKKTTRTSGFMHALRSPAGALTAAALAVLGILFAVWWASNAYGALGRFAAFLSALLFAAAGARFLPEWLRFWNFAAPAYPEDATNAKGKDERRTMLRIFLLTLAGEAVIFLLAWLFCALFHKDTSPGAFWNLWLVSDSRHYLDIAREWYLTDAGVDRAVQLVFLPGYPILLRAVSVFTGDLQLAGMLLSCLSFAGAGVLLYHLMRLDHDKKEALWAVRFLFLVPGVFFFLAPMSESLFLFLCLACLDLSRRGHPVLGALLGGYAAFTRSLGLLLVVPLVMELVHGARCGKNRKSFLPRLAALPLVPAGFGAYLLVNFTVSGNPLQFLIYQREHWSQQLGYFFNTAAYQTEYLRDAVYGGDKEMALGLWSANLFVLFGSLVLILLTVKSLRPSRTAWFFAYYIVAVGATWLLSAPRYFAALPVLPEALSILARKRAGKIVVLCILVPVSLLYLAAFVLQWQVW